MISMVEGTPRMLVVFSAAAALVVGAIISLASGSWWFLALAVALHGIGTAAVIRTIVRRIDAPAEGEPVERDAPRGLSRSA